MNHATTWKAQQSTDAMNQFLYNSEERKKEISTHIGDKKKEKREKARPLERALQENSLHIHYTEAKLQ